MKKIIIIDLDGTALADGQTIAPKTQAALQAAKMQGHEIVIATGRPLNAMHHFAEKINPTAIVTSNGAVVMTYHQQELSVIARQGLDGSLFERAIGQQLDDIETVWLEAHDQTLITNLHPHLAVVFNSHRPIGFEYQQKNQLRSADYEQAQVCLLLLKQNRDVEVVAQQLRARLGAAYQLHCFVEGGVQFIELSLAHVNKATGLQTLQQMYAWEFSEMIAFGDQYNDQEMLQAVGHGVAMQNAPQAIQDLADAVTTYDNVNGGVGIYLTNYLK
ncbi:MAG: Cof-type HAD-IIB family hydrolase [Culicoidibacterales bacterium]